ncbi:hypothetical protein [Aliiroseovarius lamellibrachiae]|uniref:hypothetical protein n=1 Tax=Aliiroseovarius lamellibrachiae TaxID=1924933 RepID=UPI001BE041C6|nr:hypothetical protein [Aliiroseovarius lamellibrachiae]MBT2131223.1 hypothetical protein [Aliiroseovarius lamellibrachiae]
MSDTLLSDLPQAVCDELKSFMPKLKKCDPHAGKFDLGELKKAGFPASSVLVSNLGAKQDTTYGQGAPSYMLRMAAYVVTKDGLGVNRDTLAANICQVLLRVIPGKTWSQSGYGQARDVAMQTLVSSKIKDKGVSLWAVTWHQPISFFAPEPTEIGAELYVGQSPAIGAANVADYDQVGGAS